GVSLDTITLTAMGPSSGVDGNLGLSGSMALAGMSRAISLSMPFNLDPRSRTVRLSPSARIDDLPIETLEPVRITAGEAGIDAAGALSLLGGRLEFSGSRGEAGLALSASALDLDAAILARLSNRPALRGSVGGVLSLEGAGEELEGALQVILADIAQARPDAPEVSGTLETALGSDGMQAVLSLSDAEGALNLTGRAELPVLVSADPFEVRLPTGASLQSEFNGTGAIEPIWSIIGPADTALTGQFELAATVNGPLSDLAPEGSLVIREGDLEDALVGLHLKEIDLTADLDPQAVSVRSLSAQGWRGGRVTGSGRYGFGGTSSVALQLDQLDALQRDDLRAVVSGRLSLTDEENGASLAGRLIFESAEVNVDELPSGGYTTLDVQFPNGNGEIKTDDAPERVPIALDIDLDADRRIQIIGAGLETEWRIDANLGGTVRAPFLTGSADLVRGDLDVLGRAFPLEGSAIRFNGPVEDAELALRAQRTEDGFMAGFAITGTAGAPEFGLTSSPQVPDDEVLSRALFGTSPSQLSALQAAQLAAGLAQLAGGGGPDLFGGLEDALDVDRIDLGFEEDGAASIGAGKYIAEDVYLEVTTTTRGAPGLGVQWTPRDNIEVGAEFGTEVPPRFSLQWTRDYGGPDTPPEPEVEPSEPDEES
ncbi:MAG: translocation/assembly module TamB domain-containing protein, partial [Pseudomonadota bacterium]